MHVGLCIKKGFYIIGTVSVKFLIFLCENVKPEEALRVGKLEDYCLRVDVGGN